MFVQFTKFSQILPLWQLDVFMLIYKQVSKAVKLILTLCELFSVTRVITPAIKRHSSHV